MNYSDDNKVNYVFFIPFFILIIELFSTTVYAMDSAALFKKALMSFEVEGVSLSTQTSELEGVLVGAGYKLKNTSKKRQQIIYNFVRGKGKTSSSAKVSATPDGAIKSIRVSLRDANIESLMNNEKARYEKSFADFSQLCQSKANVFKCHSFTATDKISISIKSSAKAITYEIISRESTKAKKITQKRQAQARANELALIEAARQEELRKEREAQRAVAQAEFEEKMADHPCFQFDVNNQKQVLTCLQTLEMSRVKSEKNVLPSVWAEQGACPALKKNLGINLKSMGFWEEAIKKRIPDCKLFAKLHKEKYGTDVYWSGCIDKPEKINTQYIVDCIDFSQRRSPKYIGEFLPVFLRKFSAAGHVTDNQSDPELRTLIQSVWTLRNDQVNKQRKEQKEKQLTLRAKEDKRVEQYRYKTYYEKTAERERSKYSDAERRLMKNNKLVIPTSYAPPSAEEVRLAVIRSIVARLKGHGIEAVVTDGHTLFSVKKMLFVRRGVGVEIRSEEVKNLTCQKRTNSAGYMCRYNMGQTALLDKISKTTFSSSDPVIQGLKRGVNFALSYLKAPSSKFQSNWFVLTDSGWNQPYTDDQIADIKQRNEEARKKAAAFQMESERLQQSFDNWLR